jgi:hypothetical protein
VASSLIAETGTEQQRRDLLPGLADGSVTASLALTGDVRQGTHGTLHGDAGPALGVVWATLHLVRVGGDIVVLWDDAVQTPAVDGLHASLGVTRLKVGGVQAPELWPGAGKCGNSSAGRSVVSRRSSTIWRTC